MTATLFLDIETAPLTIQSWGVYETNALTIEEPFCLLGMAYAWGEFGKVKTLYPEHTDNWGEHRVENEDEILDRTWHLLDDADMVMGHNSDKFDIKKINARLVRAGYGPPSPYRTVDTLKVARRAFAFDRNTLEYIGQYLGLGGKLQHTGLELWLDCIAGDPKAWKLMKSDSLLVRKRISVR